MVDRLQKILLNYESRFVATGASTTLIQSADEAPTTILDFEARNALGRLTWWPEGRGEFHVIDERQETLFHEELDNVTETVISGWIDRFLTLAQS